MRVAKVDGAPFDRRQPPPILWSVDPKFEEFERWLKTEVLLQIKYGTTELHDTSPKLDRVSIRAIHGAFRLHIQTVCHFEIGTVPAQPYAPMAQTKLPDRRPPSIRNCESEKFRSPQWFIDVHSSWRGNVAASQLWSSFDRFAATTRDQRTQAALLWAAPHSLGRRQGQRQVFTVFTYSEACCAQIVQGADDERVIRPQLPGNFRRRKK